MRTRYTYLGDTTVEVVVDGDAVEVNLLPAAPLPAPDPGPAEVASAPVAAPLEMCAAPAPPTKKRRALMGTIRAVKTLAFTVGGEALVYVTNNLAGLNLPPGLGLAVGAAAYGVNKALKPDGLL